MTDQITMLDEEPEAREDRVVSAALAEFDPLQADLNKLKERYGNVVYDLTNTKQNAEARTARKELVALRTSVDGAYKAWNQPVLAAQKKMREKASELKTAISAVEDPINEQIVADENRREADRAAKAAVEAEKRAAIQAAINRITGFAMDAVGESSAVIAGLQDELAAMEITLEVFGDRTGEAEQTRQKVGGQLDGLYRSTKAHEDQQAELARQRAELAAQQEQARKEAEAAEKARLAREAEERKAREQQEAVDRAARAKQEAADKEARDKAEAEAQTLRIEQARIAKAEADRIAAEQKARADELAAREAQIAAREKAARDAEEAAQRKAEAERAEKQRIADEAAAAERKRLDDIAQAERDAKAKAEYDAIEAQKQQHAKEVARLARIHNAAEVMLGALQCVAATPRIPKEVLAIVNDAIALALVDGEQV